MSWERTYETWKAFEGLEEELRDDLIAVEGDQAKLEDAFYTNLEFGTAVMSVIICA